MKKSKLITLCIFLCSFSGLNAQTQQQALLQDNNVVLKPIEEVLPNGHVIHIRLNNAWKMVEDTEALMLSFIDKKMLPPQMKFMLDGENPLLKLLGLRTIHQPINNKRIAVFTGVNPEKPLSLTLYPDRKSLFIISVPILNYETFSIQLAKLTTARKITPFSAEGYSGSVITTLNPDLPPRLYVTCSKNYAYICSSEDLVRSIHIQDKARMSSNAVIQKSLGQYADENLMVVVNVRALKAFLLHAKRFEQIPPFAISRARRGILSSMTPQLRFRLYWNFGIVDLERSLDYMESFLTASYETSFKYLYKHINNFHGIALSLNIGEKQESLQFSFYSDDFKAEENSQRLDMKEMLNVLSTLPGDRSRFAINGQASELKQNGTSRVFLEKLKSKFTAHKLDFKYYNFIESFYKNYRLLQPLSSRVAWNILFSHNDRTVELPKSFQECLEFVFKEVTTESTLQVLGTKDENILLKYYQNEAEAFNSNNEALVGLHNDFELSSPMFLHSNSVTNSKQHGLNRLVIESSYKTQGGVLGYDEHELINRRYLYSKQVGDYLFIKKSTPGKWLQSTNELKRSPLSPAIMTLLEQVPDNASYVEVSRSLQDIGVILHGLANLENNLHVEVDTYLEKVISIFSSCHSEKMAEIEKNSYFSMNQFFFVIGSRSPNLFKKKNLVPKIMPF